MIPIIQRAACKVDHKFWYKSDTQNKCMDGLVLKHCVIVDIIQAKIRLEVVILLHLLVSR